MQLLLNYQKKYGYIFTGMHRRKKYQYKHKCIHAQLHAKNVDWLVKNNCYDNATKGKNIIDLDLHILTVLKQ